jgi:nitric oxide reductase NorD protein
MVMNVETLKETFYTLVSPDIPNDWDVEEAVENLASLDEAKCCSALDQVPVIWPVSHSLCFDYLKTVASALDCFAVDNLSEWVNSTLDQYEKQGLRAAQRYMADVEGNFLCPLRGESGVPFKRVHGRLLPYLRGLSGISLELAPHDVVHTDTSTVYVPHEITLFTDDADNIFFYKLIVTYQWAFIACSSYTVAESAGANRQGQDGPTEDLWLQGFIDSFPHPRLAGDLYHLLETIRVTTFLESELPGLMRRKRSLSDQQQSRGLPLSVTSEPVCRLRNFFLAADNRSADTSIHERCLALVERHGTHARSAMDSVRLTRTLYRAMGEKAVEYTPVEPLLYQGVMRLDGVRHARSQRLEQSRELFVDALVTRLLQQRQARSTAVAEQPPEGPGAAPDKEGVAVVVDARQQDASNASDSTVVITIDNEKVQLDDELQRLASSITSDLGYLPEQYVSSAVGRAGKGYAPFPAGANEEGPELTGPVIYDEWDYRRNDFRKKWCNVLEKPIPLTRSSFYPMTLEKYHGQINRLRYQFELMRTSERFIRRQRDGDDIDLDALIESLADSRAGLAPSDRLFIRLRRDERDIAVLFLVDMSNSTQGWVNEAIKESLVLLCEALEVVGDRYGIYGFSGMRRLRTDFFHIKHLDEPYDELVKQRISSIAPREYTRMGPALRHATTLLDKVDSRLRLLVTLSDGKPEDYDDYKGEYAVEDTRHALIEAKAAGIHPFCITVDRHAQEYIGHMYGSVNYIQIDDVKKLPHRMPEIYRVLTN